MFNKNNKFHFIMSLTTCSHCKVKLTIDNFPFQHALFNAELFDVVHKRHANFKQQDHQKKGLFDEAIIKRTPSFPIHLTK